MSYDFKLDNGEILKSVNYFTPEHLCKGKYKDLDYAIKTSLNLIKQIDEGLWNHLLDPQTLNSNKFELSYSDRYGEHLQDPTYVSSSSSMVSNEGDKSKHW